MSFATLLGQPTARAILERALTVGRVHHAYRFQGPLGVGKETAAFLFAQALLCELGPRTAGGCGACSACRRAVTLSPDAPSVPIHPDVILVGRGLYPAQLLGGTSEATGISVEQVRRIVLSRVGYPPHEGRAMVIIVRDADELTPAAANALLKTLEEPHAGIHFVLLTSRPAKLLDTIISRTLAVRFGPLPDAVMEMLLEREGLPSELALHAQGSLERARALSEPELREAREAFVQSLDEVLREGEPAAALRFAEQRPEGRDELVGTLAHVATVFAARARESRAMTWAVRHQEVVRSIAEVERNGSPALVLESMALRLLSA